MTIEDILDHVVAVEGGYSNHPSDPGGATKYGITYRVAQENGYRGNMRDLSRDEAMKIYRLMYVTRPGFDLVHSIYPILAAELIDSGINAGVSRAVKWLQMSLNSLNSRGKHYPNISEDGKFGPGTASALKAYKARRGAEGEEVLKRCCDILQGAHYMDLAVNDSKFEDFLYGWVRTRIG